MNAERLVSEINKKYGFEFAFDGELELIHPKTKIEYIEMHPEQLDGACTAVLGQRKFDTRIEFSFIYDGLEDLTHIRWSETEEGERYHEPEDLVLEPTRFEHGVANVFSAYFGGYWLEVLDAVVLHLERVPAHLEPRFSLPPYLAGFVGQRHIDLLHGHPGEEYETWYDILQGMCVPIVYYGDGDQLDVIRSGFIDVED